jgi:hypothetical protein
MKINKLALSALSVAALAFTFSACNNTAVSNNTAANSANKTNAATNNAVVVSDAKTNSAQNAETNKPAGETNERKAVLDALRVPVSKDLKQEIIFVVDKFKTQGEWAFVAGKPKKADGGEPDWKITKYQKFIDSGDFEEGLYGLLKKTNGKWEVVTYLMNCHDVCYLGWETEYKAPKSLFE